MSFRHNSDDFVVVVVNGDGGIHPEYKKEV